MTGAIRHEGHEGVRDGWGGAGRAATELKLGDPAKARAFRLGDRGLVVTTDFHVVQPIFFPGGDMPNAWLSARDAREPAR
ncbi:MAG: hypothetical protein HY704_17355 [Gemmatimonadetes bacterium]|nr:hypothetical protein [Gemmatimonadota bacterium]